MSSRRRWVALGAGLVLGSQPSTSRVLADADELAPPFARTAERESPRELPADEFSMDVLLETTLPLTLGGRIVLEAPGHVLFHVAAGVVATPLIDAINDVGTGWGAWTPTDARVCRALLGDATWFEAGVGIRPAATPGIELSVGYLLLWSHRVLDAQELGIDIAPAAVALDVTVDALHVELAWQTVVGDFVSFRVALGWAHALAHRVAIVGEDDAPQVRRAVGVTQLQLAEEVGRRAFGPTLSVALGIRLF